MGGGGGVLGDCDLVVVVVALPLVVRGKLRHSLCGGVTITVFLVVFPLFLLPFPSFTFLGGFEGCGVPAAAVVVEATLLLLLFAPLLLEDFLPLDTLLIVVAVAVRISFILAAGEVRRSCTLICAVVVDGDCDCGGGVDPLLVVVVVLVRP